MIPTQFDYVRADSVEQALDLLEENPAGKVLAGGHSLLVAMKLRQINPPTVIDVSRIPALLNLSSDGRHVHIGAAVTYATLERSSLVLFQLPLLAHVAAQVGDRQVRARGTIGGSLVNADPAADLPAALLALDAVYVAQSPSGRRPIPAQEFHLGRGQTTLRPDELLVEILVPPAPTARWMYQKFRQRSHEWALVGVVAVQDVDLRTRMALVNMGPTAVRASAVEHAASGGASAKEAAAHACAGTATVDDARADASYRNHLAVVLTARALAGLANGPTAPASPGPR